MIDNKDSLMRQHTLKIVFLTLFLDLASFSIIFPLFPDLLDYYLPPHLESTPNDLLYYLINSLYEFAELSGHNDPKFITTVLFGGILGSVYSLLQFVFAPIWGSYSDVYGRKKILLITVSGLSLSYFIWAISGNFWLLVISRVIGGIMGGNISVATAIVADVTPKNKRTSGMAIVGIAFSLGFVFGPAIGGYLGQFNLLNHYPSLERIGINPFSITALVSLGLSLTNLIWISLFLQESLPKNRRKTTKTRNLKLFSLFLSRKKNIKELNLSYLVYMTGISGMEFTLTFLAVDRFLFTSIENGLMFVFIGICLIFTQGLIARKFTPTFGEKTLASIGLSFGIVAFILLSKAHTIWLFFIALCSMAISIGLTSPSISALVSLNTDEDDQGKYLGLFRSAGSFARTIGPVVASLLYFLFGPENSYLLGACCVGVATYMLSQTTIYREN